MSLIKRQKDQRKKKYRHFTIMFRDVMETPAWKNLTSTAQAIYLWLRLEWKGKSNNNNGKISLSCRQAAAKMGVTPTTASRAIRELQAKGFLVVTQSSYLGTQGKARLQLYELTEIPIAGSTVARHLYASWKEGHDYEVISPISSRSRT